MSLIKTFYKLLIVVALALLGWAALVLAEDSALHRQAEDIYAELQHRITDASWPLMVRVDAARRISALADQPDLLRQLEAQDSVAATVLKGDEALRTYDFTAARGYVATVGSIPAKDAKRLRYRWLLLTENLQTLDSLTRIDTTNTFDQPVRGELMYRLLRYNDAEVYYEDVLRHPIWHPLEIEAKLGLAKVYQKRQEYQRALDTLTTLFAPDALNAEILYQTGLVLIDLSRVTEAIDLIEEAVRWNPDYEMAHYFLGNGYARLNYTQLHEKYPQQYGNANVQKALAPALSAFERGDVTAARQGSRTVLAKFSQAVEPAELLGSLAWIEGQADSAEDFFREALTRCPEYGRAHNGLAKSLELKRMRVNVHRGEDSLKFAQAQMPVISQIDQFVSNWKSLSPRHQKQVALAVEPWRLYLPVLVESGHHYYIKPLHERLSESPGLETIKDQRINYDSRLWDDVRGCGGYTTVTGIEDVERSIYSNYNTVLHELTHQVHGVFPPEDAQRLLDAYHTARNREEAGEKVFMSQYQASSVWEYFAEGANGYYSRRRDAYDTREIVRERLLTMDTTLQHLVEDYVTAPNLEACYPVGLVNAAQDAAEQNKLGSALAFAKKAYARTPHGEVVLAELSHLYSLEDADRKALAFADSLRVYHPRKAGSYTQWQSARFFSDGTTAAGIERLRSGLAEVDSTERKSVQLALGHALWYAGDFSGAAEQYQKILDLQSGDSDALWGLGVALGDAGRYVAADSAFQKALLERSGIATLRLDYARILLQAGRLDDAEAQEREAALLTPSDPAVLTMEGWLAAAKGDWNEALSSYDKCLVLAPHDRLPAVLRIEALRRTGHIKQAEREQKRLEALRQKDVPKWIYIERQSEFVSGYIWPAYMTNLLGLPMNRDEKRKPS